MVLSCNILAFPTHCVLESLKQLLIMLPSVNIISNSSLGKIFCIHVVYILLKLDDISCMNVRGSTDIRILEEILLLISHYSSNLTLVLFPLFKASLICNYIFLYFLLLLSFFFSSLSSFLFLFLPSCCFSMYVCSYEVATIVCPHTLCNKLMIF